MKSRKKIRERICAGLGAFVLTFYALIEGAPAVIRTVQAAQPTEAEPHVLRESGEQTAAPEEESSGSEQTESAAYPYEDLPAEARKALAEENIPLAGYETYSEAELSAIHKNEKSFLRHRRMLPEAVKPERAAAKRRIRFTTGIRWWI